jgi:hypothetical protein
MTFNPEGAAGRVSRMITGAQGAVVAVPIAGATGSGASKSATTGAAIKPFDLIELI